MAPAPDGAGLAPGGFHFPEQVFTIAKISIYLLSGITTVR
jgi:hypothetical protein